MKESNKIITLEEHIEVWKMTQLINFLQSVKGRGTSLMTLMISPEDQISRINNKLAEEISKANRIKSSLNRVSVLAVIELVQQKLKLYSSVPTNGLIIYCGIVVNDAGKERKLIFDFEPFKPLISTLYNCDKTFVTEPLKAFILPENRFGFIVVDVKGALFGMLEGNKRLVFKKFSVNLPRKHGRGGRSEQKFELHRKEKRNIYMKKVAEAATQLFITDEKPNITGIVLAGTADFKVDLSKSDMFDKRIQDIVIDIVDVQYGSEHGFNQAINLEADKLQSVKLIQEKKFIAQYFKEIAQETGKYCFGVEDSLNALGMIETLLCWEHLNIQRYVLKSYATNQEIILHLTPDQAKNKSYFKDKESGAELILVEKQSLLLWLANNYKSYGVKLVIITDDSQEGKMFVKAFGGIGGLLRYSIDKLSIQFSDEQVEEDY